MLDIFTFKEDAPIENGREKKKDNMLNISTPTDQVTEKDMRDLLEQLPAPRVMLRSFNEHTHCGEVKKMSTRGRMLEKIFNRYNHLCLNEKEETYYRAYHGRKLPIDLTIENLTIAPEYKWSKEYKLREVIISQLL